MYLVTFIFQNSIFIIILNRTIFNNLIYTMLTKVSDFKIKIVIIIYILYNYFGKMKT